MKISLCMFLLCRAAVSVIGQSVELNGVIGENVRFEAEVNNNGSLMYKGSLIADVTNRVITPNDKYKDRVHWDTGYFSLSGLKLEDSGEYKVENHGNQASTSTFQLTVWKDNVPVTKPNISVIRDEYPCILLCTVERGTAVTLSWYRESAKRGSIHTVPLNAPNIKLSISAVQTGVYICEGRNSVSNETASITVGDHCTGGAAGIWQTEGRKIWGLCLLLIVILHSHLV